LFDSLYEVENQLIRFVIAYCSRLADNNVNRETVAATRDPKFITSQGWNCRGGRGLAYHDLNPVNDRL